MNGETDGQSAALLRQLGGLVGQSGGLGAGGRRHLHVNALRHLHTDDVHQALEDLPDVDILLGARLEILKACERKRRGK